MYPLYILVSLPSPMFSSCALQQKSKFTHSTKIHLTALSPSFGKTNILTSQDGLSTLKWNPPLQRPSHHPHLTEHESPQSSSHITTSLYNSKDFNECILPECTNGVKLILLPMAWLDPYSVYRHWPHSALLRHPCHSGHHRWPPSKAHWIQYIFNCLQRPAPHLWKWILHHCHQIHTRLSLVKISILTGWKV